MAVTRWQPFTGLWADVDRLNREVNRLFRGAGSWPELAVSFPPVNVWEDHDNVYVEAELPGLTQDQLEIYVSEGNQLTLSGERKADGPEKGTWHRQERGFGKFSRTVALPILVDSDKVAARFEQGVLHVTLPKSEKAKPRRISVKAE